MAKDSQGWKTFFEKSVEKAKKLDAAGMLELSNKALNRLSKQQHRIDSFGRDIKDLAGLVASFAKGQYKEVPWKIVVSCAAALLYFLNPFDLVPDMIFGVGFLDDITVAAFVVKSFSEDIEKYRIWRENQKPSN